MMCDNLGVSLPHVRSGKLKALAVASKQRFAGLPDAPALAETLPVFECLVFERIEIFRLAREQARDEAVLEHAARVALAHELGEVGTEQHVEDRIGFGVVDRL